MLCPDQRLHEEAMANQNEDRASIMPYSTDCYAEFYDVWNGSFWGQQWLDIVVYWDVIQSLIASHKNDPYSNSPINVIDMGCGSGRATKDLLERSRDSASPLTNIKIYGIDPSATMLQRAKGYLRAHPDLQAVAPVEWVNARGEDFTSVLPHLKGSCDFIAWSGGGFSHLISEENQLLFLQQVAIALRANSSTAIGLILVLDESIPRRNSATASEVFELPWEGRSEDNPDVTFHKSANEVEWEGPVRHNRWTVSMRKGGELFYTEKIAETLVNLDEEKWPSLVEKAGLRIIRAQEMDDVGIFYYLQKVVP